MTRFAHRKTVSVCALIVGLVACGGNDSPPNAQTTDAATGARPGGAPGGRMGGGMGGGRGGFGGPPSNVVEVQAVARGSIARQVTVPGVVEPIRTIGVNSQIAGALLSVNAQEGDIVRRGAVLARLDDREVSAQLAAAQASLDVAEASYARATQLRERRVITLPEFERERTALAAAQAQVEQLRTRRSYATVVAPASGVITEKHVEQGDVVGSNSRLFTIADISELVVKVGVSELDVVELSNGDRVTITLDAIPNRQLRGRIRRIFPTADPATRLVPAEVVLDAESARLARAGFLARVTFDLATSDNVLLLPVSAVLGGQGAQAVFVVDNNTATRRTVTTGLTSRGQIEIVSGLTEGEKVVVTGATGLRDGMTVRVAGQGGAGAAEQGGTAGPPAGATPPAGARTRDGAPQGQPRRQGS